jgi:hypothetical protein
LDASEREVSQDSVIEQEPSEAEALLNLLLGMGCTFEVLHQGGKEWLIWFGPRASVAPAIREQVAQRKAKIVSLFRNGRRQSRREWGEPEGSDWQDGPSTAADSNEPEP